MIPFHPLFRNPHAQTVVSHYWPRPALPQPTEQRLFSTEPGVQVLVESDRPPGDAAGELVLVHGLEGSSQAGYMRGAAVAAVRAGYAAHRINLRTCGGTEHLCPTLYHAGLTTDVAGVLGQLRAERPGPFFLAGFSLGGNVVLKLAGELADEAAGWIAGVCALSTPLDLEACVKRIGERDNRIYENRFIARMRKRMCATGRYSARDFSGIRTLWEIDDRITAPAFGFDGAAHYYRTQSAIGYLDRIRVPALLVQSRDDTYVPWEVYERPAVHANSRVALLATEYGGHLGFLGRRPYRYWADHAIIEWMRLSRAKEAAAHSSRF